MVHFWELCLSAWETSWPGPPVNKCRKEEINTWPLESSWNKEIFTSTYCLFYFTSSSSPLCSIKKKLIKIKLSKNKAQLSNPVKMVLWDTSTPSFQCAGLPNKYTIPCSNASSLDLLACHAVSSRSLDSVTFFLQPCLRWPYCELRLKEYSLPAKVYGDKIQSRHT